jgi:hypothetical protein
MTQAEIEHLAALSKARVQASMPTYRRSGSGSGSGSSSNRPVGTGGSTAGDWSMGTGQVGGMSDGAAYIMPQSGNNVGDGVADSRGSDGAREFHGIDSRVSGTAQGQRLP